MRIRINKSSIVMFFSWRWKHFWHLKWMKKKALGLTGEEKNTVSEPLGLPGEETKSISEPLGLPRENQKMALKKV